MMGSMVSPGPPQREDAPVHHRMEAGTKRGAREGRRGPPLLENPGLFIWALVIDLVLVHVWWLLTTRPYAFAAVLHLGVFSTLTFLLFLTDKVRARKETRRVSELNLLLFSIFGGAAGGLLAMILFRHKLKPLKFRILLPAALFLHIALLLVVTLEST